MGVDCFGQLLTAAIREPDMRRMRLLVMLFALAACTPQDMESALRFPLTVSEVR